MPRAFGSTLEYILNQAEADGAPWHVLEVFLEKVTQPMFGRMGWNKTGEEVQKRFHNEVVAPAKSQKYLVV